ncbi:MAG: hopanoid biosynthesis-associated RND transporter HpnN [Gammaproteobacteria bacterium]|nr:MAG: hopanoid biosynthesis-associated RND transporter HpnN [Gammaproteobacteria bacterium]
MNKFEAILERTITGLAARMPRWRYAVVVFYVLLTGVAAYYTSGHLGMNTDTRDMLSPELSWRRMDLEYEKEFPVHTNNIIAVIEAGTPDQAADAAEVMYERLQHEQRYFHTVFYPAGLPLFRKSGFLYLETAELQDLADNLATIQPFLARLTGDQTLRGLLTMIREAITAIEDGEDIDIASLAHEINLTLLAAQRQRPYQVSWQKLMNHDGETERIYREFIILQPIMDYDSLFPGREPIARLRALAGELQFPAAFNATLRLTGSVVLADEEFESVSRGTSIASFVSFLLVALLLIIGLGSYRMVFATLACLLIDLVLTTAFAALAIGNLNLISIAFAVLVIGLGADFAIFYCLRYRELRLDGLENAPALNETSASSGVSLLLCACTTAISFYSFMPTDYLGVAELGLIAGTGMLISFVITLTLLPALFSIFPYRSGSVDKLRTLPASTRRLLALPIRHHRKITLGALMLFPVLIWLTAQSKFDPNTLNMQDPDNESVKTYQDLLADNDTTPWTGIVIAAGQADAKARARDFLDLPLVENTVWLEDFIPADQDEKLAIVEEMSLLLGDLADESASAPLSDAQRREELTRTFELLNRTAITGAEPELERLRNNLRDYLEYLSVLEGPRQTESLHGLEDSLLRSLPGRVKRLTDSLDADYIALDNLPEEISQRWHNGEDKYLIEIYPRQNLNDNAAMRAFVLQLQASEPDVVGSPVLSIEAGDAVVGAFKQAFLYAFIAIVLLLLFLMKYKRDMVLIVGGMILASVMTCSFCVLLDIPFNFANIIALPLLLGIGVDSGIHILHRFHYALPEDGNLLATSSARAVVLNTVANAVSFGTLAFSSHRGTASMGVLLTIGLLTMLFCMLFILPAFCVHAHNNRKSMTPGPETAG